MDFISSELIILSITLFLSYYSYSFFRLKTKRLRED